ncbi:hypothetical protein GCM10009682_23640 [Luedemannella flava]|uniref:Phage holin family protein n=1 Tax=Luedemannella flava TaxID=349316 RepID=A0ABN2LXX5_9ACTN
MEAIMDTMSRRPSTPTEPPVERLAQDMAAVVHDEVAKVRADVGGILRRGGTGALLLGAAGVCGILALGSAATTILRTADAVLPRRLAAASVTTGYLAAGAVLAWQGWMRLRAMADGGQQVMRDVGGDLTATTEQLAAATATGVREAARTRTAS